MRELFSRFHSLHREIGLRSNQSSPLNSVVFVMISFYEKRIVTIRAIMIKNRSHRGENLYFYDTFSMRSMVCCRSIPKSINVHSIPSLVYSSCSRMNMWWLKNCCNFSLVKFMQSCSKLLYYWTYVQSFFVRSVSVDGGDWINPPGMIFTTKHRKKRKKKEGKTVSQLTLFSLTTSRCMVVTCYSD